MKKKWNLAKENIERQSLRKVLGTSTRKLMCYNLLKIKQETKKHSFLGEYIPVSAEAAKPRRRSRPRALRARQRAVGTHPSYGRGTDPHTSYTDICHTLFIFQQLKNISIKILYSLR